jgi:hypothetical protein
MTGTVEILLVLLCFILVLYFYVNSNSESYADFIKYSGNTGYPTKQLCKMPLTTPLPELSGPADATLNSPRDPYNLLDYLEPATLGGSRTANFTSECAYIADGQRRIEKTGSYGQVTNNYKHKKPDNGSTWLHELSVSFYK